MLQKLQLRLRTNDVETGRSEAYPDISPLDLDVPPDTAWRMARAAAEAMPRWTVQDVDGGDRTVRAEATTPVLRFTDDVWIRVEPRDGGSRVRMRSASRVGVTDFGANARRVRDFLSRLARTEPAG